METWRPGFGAGSGRGAQSPNSGGESVSGRVEADPTALKQGQRPHHPVASVWVVPDARDSVEDLGEASVWGQGSSEF